MKIFRSPSEVDHNKYFIVEYYVDAKTNLREAAWQIAIGFERWQSQR